MTNLGIVILNYQSYKDTIKLVENLQLQTILNDIQIVVVDNASPNHSFDKLMYLEKQFLNVKVLKTKKNLGYAKGNNFGLNYLDKQIQPEFVAILNNDIILKDNCFEKLICKYKLLKKPAIIAPKQLDLNNKEIQPYKLNSFLDDCLNLFFIFKLFHKRNALQYIDNTGQKAMKVSMIPGSFMFSSFKTFKEMDFFYPNTFLFAEERFIAMKARVLNLKNYILLDETYIHAHSKTINKQYSKISKYKLLYNSWLEFTKVYRTYPNFKVWILKNLMKLSIIEMRFLHKIKIVFKGL